MRSVTAALGGPSPQLSRNGWGVQREEGHHAARAPRGAPEPGPPPGSHVVRGHLEVGLQGAVKVAAAVAVPEEGDVAKLLGLEGWGKWSGEEGLENDMWPNIAKAPASPCLARLSTRSGCGALGRRRRASLRAEVQMPFCTPC